MGVHVHFDRFVALTASNRLKSRWIPSIPLLCEIGPGASKRDGAFRAVGVGHAGVTFTPVVCPLMPIGMVKITQRIAVVVSIAACSIIIGEGIIANGTIAAFRSSEVAGFPTETTICALSQD